MDKRLQSKINNPSHNIFCTLEAMYIAQQIIWRKRLEEYDEKFQLYILQEVVWSNKPARCAFFFFTNDTLIMHATNTCYNKKCNSHLRIVAIISIIGFIDRSAHVTFHVVQISSINNTILCNLRLSIVSKKCMDNNNIKLS